MKLSTIAKTSLALGILTTGVMTTYAQSADAEAQASVQNNNQSQDVKDLLTYYSQTGHDLRNVSGYRDGDKVNVIDRGVHTEVDLLGTDKSRINDDFLKSKFDVFVVGEGTGKQAPTRTIGGITKPNNKEFKDQVVRPQLTITKQNGDFKIIHQDGPFNIFKEQISLKELDFKLRKHLIEKHGLYSKGANKGDIIIKMKGDNVKNRYTFELHKKLQEHRMGDVIDATQIDRIDVEYK
ncbi:superantigen-like protein [Staphylococcus hyicus]|uniref:exotoxin beta-grasp domain-containing protein n=1 Tax=Staphylococcus hyicus TaxID=1284 RepID=UPI000D1D8002|nr:superantigen-like protein [Staphylococcus hyicus]MDP4448628.1 superantigen-like protein [Staphylococcus hyicus]PTJ71141.1 superantigen-like protein [Staphylococcus hyicus]PTJ86463.1 superantigen-like protein [Staphylococcus hyicus]